MRFLKYTGLFSGILLMLSCVHKNNKPIIMFAGDRSSIIIKNIDAASLLQIKNAWHRNPDSLHLIDVVLSPGVDDLVQDEQEVAGKLNLTGDSLTFQPHQPFQKGKNYLVESYIGVEFANTGKLFSGGIKHNLQPQQQILTR